jgi:hypothetical protein
MKRQSSPLAAGLLSGLLLFGFVPSPAAAGDNRLELVGVYRYAYHDPVGPVEAGKLACMEAARLAVESSRYFIDATSTVVDSQLVRDLAQKLVAGYFKDVQVLEQSEKGRTVYCKVKGYLNPEDTNAVIATEVNRSLANEPLGIDQNRAIKIIGVQERKDGTVVVVYKALKRLDWLSTAYDGSLREFADVMIDYYDDQGIPVGSDRHPGRVRPDGREVMNPGEITAHAFRKPAGTKSYRVWLVK